ncbi:MAG: enoyl-CoA hydratase/isomerase family protein [Candidatus Freyarchaeota archaeon]|nr:enoyl-CoA hydratase/isomerase family protein [Candidatus Jordarchaeia archaeon]MBS7280621.1 enoyl-CoA hydratase/isomerase family protein [Candidatus Jordarchaeia archaeon]
MKDLKTIRIDKEDGIGIITLNRPEKRNAINFEMFTEIGEAADIVSGDDDIKSVIITGAGPSFSAGIDFNSFGRFGGISSREFRNLGRKIQIGWTRIENIEKPVIAAINGSAIGGGLELALCCDIRIAADNARMGIPEVCIGIVPDLGGAQRLPRIVGLGRAKELIFTGRIIEAQEAERIGLVNRVVPAEKLMDSAKELAREIMDNGLIAVGLAKKIANKSMEVDMETILEYSILAQDICIRSENMGELFNRYMQKKSKKK